MITGIMIAWGLIGLASFPKVYGKMSEHAPNRINDLGASFVICLICGPFATLIYRK